MSLDDWIKIAPLVSAGVTAASAAIAFGAFIYTRRTNRKRATLDMVMRTFLDDRGTKLYDDFRTLIRRDKAEDDAFCLTSLANHTPENEAYRTTVIDQLNNYELISLGIRRGLFDEAFYKLWFHRQFTRDFESVEQLVSEVQKERPSTYYEYRALYNRWKRNQHPVNQPGKIKMTWWVLRGDLKSLDAARTGMQASA